jgi:hypothetical protein
VTVIPLPLVVDGRAPAVLPAYPLPGRARGAHPLYVLERTIYFRTLHGWHRVPRGYVTDFASIPDVVIWLSFSRLEPLAAHAWAAVAHDFGYAIGEPGKRPAFDGIFRERMELDGVPAARRWEMYNGVRLGGQGGYDKAPGWWSTENFADPETGEYPVPPPFRREEAFAGARWGVRERPDWNELPAVR